MPYMSPDPKSYTLRDTPGTVTMKAPDPQATIKHLKEAVRGRMAQGNIGHQTVNGRPLLSSKETFSYCYNGSPYCFSCRCLCGSPTDSYHDI